MRSTRTILTVIGAGYLKMTAFIALLLSIILILSSVSSACTIFVKKQGDKILAGNNEDFYYSFSSDMWIVSASEGSYGRVCFGNSSYVQGGMNEKGLFYDGATCPDSQVPYIEGNPTLGSDLGEVILSKCADVEEAIDFLKRHNTPQGFGDHLLIADETGASAVVEWVENEMRVISGDDGYLIATNFFISNPRLGGHPCTRYDKVKSLLEEEKELSVKLFEEILSAVIQNWSEGGTKYSNICDLRNKNVYVYSMGDFSKRAFVSLTDEIGKMKPGDKIRYNIDDLRYYDSEDSEELDAPQDTAGESVETAETPSQVADKPADAAEQLGEIAEETPKPDETLNSVDNAGFFILAIIVTIILLVIPVMLFKKEGKGL